MEYRTLRVAIGLLIVFVTAVAPIGWAAARSNPPQAPAELLVNPGFEEPFISQGNDIFVANGWQAWYLTPDGVTYPTRCPEPTVPTCTPYGVPSYRISQPQDQRVPPRARSGNSQQWGASYVIYIAGLYQQVNNVTPGARLRFSAFTQAFNCSDDLGCFGGVGEVGKSYEAGANSLRVGIDPTGGANAFSANIVWSGYANPLDAFVQQSVEAVAQAASVTVFVASAPNYPEKHLDIYVDDASLIAVGQGEVATATPATSSTPDPTTTPGTPSPTATIPPNTGTYAIQSGDTLSAVAERYNLTLDQLLALNPSLTRESILQVGQVITLGGTPQPTTPTPIPTSVTPTVTATVTISATAATTLTLSTSTPVADATVALATLGMCLSAYDDPNGNGLRETGEGLIAGAQFTVTDASGQITATYASDGGSEPHCLATLPDGRYLIDIVPPTNRIATTDLKWSVSLLSGTSVNIHFGSRAAPTATPAVSAATPGAGAAITLTPAVVTRSASAPLGLLVGGAFILLSIAAGAFVVSSRRRR